MNAHQFMYLVIVCRKKCIKFLLLYNVSIGSFPLTVYSTAAHLYSDVDGQA
ncbi:hypothetical protein D3C76_88530 [compost metagenome]